LFTQSVGILSMESLWPYNWALGLSLTTLIIVAHVSAIVRAAIALRGRGRLAQLEMSYPTVAVALIALFSTVSLGVAAMIWAALYVWVGAVADWRDASLYSLSAITSYGHAEVYLDGRWRLLGAIEAMNGTILLGLTAAFLFAVIQRVVQATGVSKR
jgi:hypothetical protein